MSDFPSLDGAREALVECGAHTADDRGNHGLCRRPAHHPGFCDPSASIDPYRRHLASVLAAVDILIAERDAQQARAERAEALLRKADEALLVITAIVDDPSDYESALRDVDDVARSAQRHGAVPSKENLHG